MRISNAHDLGLFLSTTTAGALKNRTLTPRDVGKPRYHTETFSHRGYKAILGKEGTPDGRLRPKVFLASTLPPVGSLTFRHLRGASIRGGTLMVGGRPVLPGWHRDDFATTQTFLSGDHYVVRPYPLPFRVLAQIPDALESPQITPLTKAQVTALQANGTLGGIPRGHSVIKIVSPTHEIHDSEFPEIIIVSVDYDKVSNTITVNYTLKLTLADPDRFGSVVQPGAYFSAKLGRIGPVDKIKFVRNFIEGA